MRIIICETTNGSPADVALDQLGYRGRMLKPMRSDVKWGNYLFKRAEGQP